MALDSPTSDLPQGAGKSDVEKDAYITDASGTGHHEHPIVADLLARKLSARQVQMIAIGMWP